MFMSENIRTFVSMKNIHDLDGLRLKSHASNLHVIFGAGKSELFPINSNTVRSSYKKIPCQLI